MLQMGNYPKMRYKKAGSPREASKARSTGRKGGGPLSQQDGRRMGEGWGGRGTRQSLSLGLFLRKTQTKRRSQEPMGAVEKELSQGADLPDP